MFVGINVFWAGCRLILTRDKIIIKSFRVSEPDAGLSHVAFFVTILGKQASGRMVRFVVQEKTAKNDYPLK